MSLNDEFSDGTRLNKFISDSGHCSRREADKLIESKRVKVNGKLPKMGCKVIENDEVTVDDMVIYGSASNKSDRVYLAYNKPVGITCTTELGVKGNIVDAVDHDQRVFPIGRLDKPSEGLILLTSDGDIVNKILRAENAHEKEYLVTVNKAIGAGFAEKMSKGIPILGTTTKPCKVSIVGKNVFKITLTQGLNRQIRRMCAFLDYKVVQLVRLRIMNIELGKMRPGQWRGLTKDEMAQLKKAIQSSRSDATANSSKRKTHTPSQKSKVSAANTEAGKTKLTGKRKQSPKKGARPSKNSGNHGSANSSAKTKVTDQKSKNNQSKGSNSVSKPRLTSKNKPQTNSTTNKPSGNRAPPRGRRR